MCEQKLTNRQKKALETKNNLLNTALSLFQKHGFDNVTIDEITEACNVSKGAFYNHFSSKHDVLILRFKDIDTFYSSIADEVEPLTKASEKILFFYTRLSYYLTNLLGKDLIRTLYSSAFSATIDSDFLISPAQKLNVIILGYINEGLENGEFQSHYSAEDISIIITRSIHGSIYDWIIFKETTQPIEEVLKVTIPILRGIQSNPPQTASVIH